MGGGGAIFGEIQFVLSDFFMSECGRNDPVNVCTIFVSLIFVVAINYEMSRFMILLCYMIATCSDTSY